MFVFTSHLRCVPFMQFLREKLALEQVRDNLRMENEQQRIQFELKNSALLTAESKLLEIQLMKDRVDVTVTQQTALISDLEKAKATLNSKLEKTVR